MVAETSRLLGGFAEDVVKLGSINDNLPQNVKDAINTTYTKIKTGEFKPFTGPLKDNTGKKWLLLVTQ